MCANARAVGRLVAAVLLAIALLAAGASSRAADDDLLLRTHQAAGVNCRSCHAESPPHGAPANAVCVDCHGGQAKVAERTRQIKPNPHAPPHLAAGETQICGDCHHVHHPSEVACTECHHSFHFNPK